MLVSGASAAESAAPPAFAKKPAVTKAGDKTTISFAVDRETDVAVYVEDAKGAIVRHLAAGVLGKNAPEPLKAGALEQSLEWDGKDDDGKPAAGGPFKVRVGLGLKASWGGLAFDDKDGTGPNRIGDVLGMAAGPDGRVYVLAKTDVWSDHWNASKIHVFRRGGAYEKTIKPFPSNTPLERAKPEGAFLNAAGELSPLVKRATSMSFYGCEDVPHQPAVTSDGRIVLAVVPGMEGYMRAGPARLALLDTNGGIPESSFAGPALGTGLVWGTAVTAAGCFRGTYASLAVDESAKVVYISGLASGNLYKSQPTHAVYAAKLPDRGPLETFFGEAAKPGADDAHLNEPRGIAVDGKGHLLVADGGNNRVLVLNQKDKSVAGSFPVPSPGWLAVHPKSGEVYVQSGDSALVKFSGWDKPKEVARADFAAMINKTPAGAYRPTVKLTFALDASASPAALWVGCASAIWAGRSLVWCEDQGAKFGDATPAGSFSEHHFKRPATDPWRREVVAKDESAGNLRLLDEATGKVRLVGNPAYGGAGGRTHRLGPDGDIVAVDHAQPIIRFDREGKPKPFEATLKNPALLGRLPVGNTGTTAWDRDFSVDRKGDIYVRAWGPEYHGLMTVQVYGPDGRFKRTVIHCVSDAMYGPRVDLKGNLYIMESIKPLGQPFPPELKPHVSGKVAEHWFDWIYGSVIKFGPEGGAAWFTSKRLGSPLMYEGWSCAAHGFKVNIPDLRTAGGSLTGTVAGAPATVSFPGDLWVDTAAHAKVTVRLKNDTDGKQATLTWHRVKENYSESCSTGFKKTVEIKPNGDFAEYTFDLSGEKDWRESVWHLGLQPTDAAKGTFAIDWVRIGDADSKLVWNFNAEDGPDKKLPGAMKREPVAATTYHLGGAAELQGALWWKPGFSPLGQVNSGDHCHCVGSDFDVDDFGRTFAPDTGRFRVGVLDTNGNEITSIGGYGNQDNCGPESYVLDPAGKFLRPRKEGDPKDLVSPLAKPELGFAWIIGVAVTDRYAYVGDVINKRILRVKLDYAATETAAVP
ncbi:MAG TPA: hypothetical protein PK280_03920 [Planctomycetota bacterium]|nr:hypothetical protein [Planctomycetota bacterium]